jgi:diguanylate cyclase (GGDEF)-like protein
VARLGGDEFGVLLAHQHDSDAAAVAERIRVAVQQRCTAQHVTVSIGASCCSGDQFAATLEADRALYAAKAHGRNTVALSPSARSAH